MEIIELTRLLEMKTGKPVRKSGNSYSACCPAHEDSNPSLSLGEGTDGKLLLYCYAGCTIEAICQSLGIQIKNLFNDPSHRNVQRISRTEYFYHNESRQVVYKKVRVEPGRNGKSKGFYQEQPSKDGKTWKKNLNGIERVLYRLPEVLQAKEKGELIYLSEGEKDCDRLVAGGLIATTGVEGAAGPWRQQYTDTLKGARVVLLYDEDIAGHGRRDEIIMHLHKSVASLKVVSLPGLVFIEKHGHDVSDWLKMGHTIYELKEIVEKTPKYKATIENDSVSNAGLSQLLVPGGSQTIQKAGQVAGRLLEETKRFFIRGGALIEVVREGGEPYFEPIKATQFASEIELVAQVVKKGSEGLEPTILNSSQAQSIMDSRSFRKEMSEIKILTKCPVLTFNEDRTLRIITGHDKERGILSFAAHPKEVSLNDAINLLLELVEDFNFATPSDRSRAIAALITPDLIFGQLILARAPLHVIEADESQTGKGFLVKLIAAVHNQRPHAITQRKGVGGGIEESLNMRLIKGDPFISFDNIRDKIDSPALESLLTEEHYLARIPYMPPIDIDPRRVILFLTSNQCEMTKDLTNRSSLIQLRKQEPGYAFKTFPEGDVIDHVLANSSRYHDAIIAIIKEWVRQGCSETGENRHDFRKWARVLDWIIQHIIGLPALMGGHKETQQRLVNKSLNWMRLVAFTILKCGKQYMWLRTADILDVIEESEMPIPGLKASEQFTDAHTRTNALTAIGKEFGACFKFGKKMPADDTSINEIMVDDIKVQRRVVTESRRTSGSCEIKEYRFMQDKSSSATVATVSLETISQTQKTDNSLIITK